MNKQEMFKVMEEIRNSEEVFIEEVAKETSKKKVSKKK